jgi:hypothetical protein
VAKKESSVANLGGNKKRGAAGISWCEKLREKTEIIPLCWAFASVYIEFATIIAVFVGAIPVHTFMHYYSSVNLVKKERDDIYL